MSQTRQTTSTSPVSGDLADDRHRVDAPEANRSDRGSERRESADAEDDHAPVVVQGGELDDASPPGRRSGAWWESEETKRGAGGRTTGSTGLRKAHDLALVADLVRKHQGDTEAVRAHCCGELGWSESRWRTISREVCRLFIVAAKEAAVMHAIGKPITEVSQSALITPRRIKITRTVRTTQRASPAGDT